MPISSLPDSTLRAITSTLVLNDAISVVKELVDNALDAKATTIAIEISANTLDVIQVKDNGTGIGIEDRQLVCKRGCTSKITTIEELERLGGSSLGFRGEALASVADLSESVTLTTRVDGEIAGSMLKYGPAGALVSCSSASHPVGSTVRVKDFLKSIPVRKQTALKDASKTLSAIKKLAQEYAFATGVVRFSFKVLKGKNESANWSYNPVDSVDKLREIAARIVGKDVAGRCEIRTRDEDEDGVGGDKCSVTALLAAIGPDAVKLNNIGHYISIDGRPVTAVRGTIKETVKLYRYYVRNCGANIQELPASFDPILVMHITCPRGSYDVNVEPAKDEVMFISPDTILNLVELLFKDYYGEHSQSRAVTTPLRKAYVVPKANESFSLLLAKRSIPSIEPTEQSQAPISSARSLQPSYSPPDTCKQLQVESESLSLPDNNSRGSGTFSEEDRIVEAVGPRVHSNMYGFDEDGETHSLSPDPHDSDNDDGDTGDVVARNPWSLAKLNASALRPSKMDASSSSATKQSTSSASIQHELVQLCCTPQASTHRQPLGLRPQLPSPMTSPRSPEVFQNPGPPKRPWPSRQRREEASGSESEPEIPAMPVTQDGQEVARPLDNWAKPIIPRKELPGFKRVSGKYDEDGRFEKAQDTDSSELSTSISHPSRVHTSVDITNHGLPQHKGPMGRPFRSPLLKPPAGSNTDRDACSPTALRAFPGSQQTLFMPPQSRNPELDQIMEFEHRKKAANAQQRKAFSKGLDRGMSIAKLAQLQRSTSHASDDDLNSTKLPGFQKIRNDLESTANAVISFGDKFDEPTTGLDAITKLNPHRNRYLSAAKTLTKSRPDGCDVVTDISDIEEGMDDGDEVPKMPEDDPRAYLMRHRSQSETTNVDGLTRTGLKIRRTKTQRLPLESIPPDMVLHDMVARVSFNMQVCTETAPGTDKYSTTGKNDFIAWNSAVTDVQTWQAELTTLIEDMYRARIGDELIAPNLGLDLRRMIKMHCDDI